MCKEEIHLLIMKNLNKILRQEKFTVWVDMKETVRSIKTTIEMQEELFLLLPHILKTAVYL